MFNMLRVQSIGRWSGGFVCARCAEPLEDMVYGPCSAVVFVCTDGAVRGFECASVRCE